MVGDGINDAPALAQADVGLVFTHEARTASSEAADIVLLGGDVQQVWQALDRPPDGPRSDTRHSAWNRPQHRGDAGGVAGFLPPLAGAILQEGIDVLVIVNALRATRGSVS